MSARAHLTVVSSSDAPAPPYPSDTRAKGWRFELDLERIRVSDTWALAPADLKPWLLMLWATAWEQTPCGSLPAEDELIAARIGMDARQFKVNRDLLLRGWVLHADGRLYHPVIVGRVHEMLDRRRSDAERAAAYRAAKLKAAAEKAIGAAGKGQSASACVTRDFGVSSTPEPEPVIQVPPNPPEGGPPPTGRKIRSQPAEQAPPADVPDPPGRRRRTRAAPAEQDDPMIELETWLRQCREQGVKPIPPDDVVFRYAETVGLPLPILQLHWWAFKRRRGQAKKRQRGAAGWRQAFRNSVEGNWFRLWFVDGDRCALTSHGRQQEIAMQAEQAERGAGQTDGDGEGA